MGRIDERVSAEFAAWEQRGRGWHAWPEPVRPEPAFREFTGYLQTPTAPEPDDSRRPSLLGSLFGSLENAVHPKPPVILEQPDEPEPVATGSPLNVEFMASLPAQIDVREEAVRAFLSSLNVCTEPIAFELLGSHDQVSLQFASGEEDASSVQRLLQAHFPELTFTRSQERLANIWHGDDGTGFIVDFGLAHEFMLPLNTKHGVDPFVGLIAVLNGLQRNELALFQILLQPVQHAWAASAWRAVTDGEGKGLFINRPHLIPGTKAKLESPLFGVVVRAAAKAPDFERTSTILRDIAYALCAFTRQDANRLIPLSNDDYEFELHEEDLIQRQSRRGGMLLNRDELLGLVHFPSNEVRAPKLKRQLTKTKSAPSLSSSGILLGTNTHAGCTVEVRLNPEQRVRHTHIIGASGTGKSMLLFNLIQQDILNGEGLAVLDPHGDLIEKILGTIPPERIDDVVLLDPTDEEYSIGFNILSAHSDFEKNLLASDLVSVFRRLSSSWGDQLNSVLNNAILAFLESGQGGTLADLRRFLLDAEFRNQFLQTVQDPDIVYYWQRGFPQLGGNKSIGPVLTRLETFLSPKPIRYMVSQEANRLDFADILDNGKIFLAKLPQGQIGKENSFLLGSLLVAKFQQMAMSRQRLSQEQRRDYFIYLDEFHNFITNSMAEILTGARKYRVGLVLAHQELHQLQRDSEVASAVMSNPCTRVVFRVGDTDAHALEKGFASFSARDIQNLRTGEAICRIERSDSDFNLSVPMSDPIEPAAAAEIRNRVITRSREQYSTPRSEIEAVFSRATELKADKPPEPRATRAEGAKHPKATTEAVDLPTEVPTVSVPPATVDLAKAEQAVQTGQLESPASSDLGRGGVQHKAIQQRLKGEAEKLGFRATIEKEVLNGAGSIDLLLERGPHVFACEIAITSTIDWEVGNVAKCAKAGFNNIVVISTSDERLEKIKAAVHNSLGEAIASTVRFFLPDKFLEALKTIPAIDPTDSARDENVNGYKVKKNYAKLSPEERSAREDGAIRVIAENMKQKKR